MINHKKASSLGHWLITIVAIIIILVWFINFISKDCRKDTDCQKDSYCDYKFTCQKFPVIDKNNSKDLLKENALFYLLIGAVIGGALTYYVPKKEFENKEKEKADKQKESANKNEVHKTQQHSLK